jgi:hypothetical protein
LSFDFIKAHTQSSFPNLSLSQQNVARCINAR